MYKLREVSRGQYDDRGYSNEETIANLMLSKPAEINQILTYTFGMDDDRFPLTLLTEGQGNAGVVDIPSDQWTWKTMGRMRISVCTLCMLHIRSETVDLGGYHTKTSRLRLFNSFHDSPIHLLCLPCGERFFQRFYHPDNMDLTFF